MCSARCAERIGLAPVRAAGGRGEQGADAGGDLVVEDGRHLDQRGDLGMVEGVDAAEDVVAGPVAHEPAAHRVLDAGFPGEVGGQALAQQVGGDPEAEVGGAETFGSGGVLEGADVAGLAGPVDLVDARHQPGGRVDLAGVGVGVEGLDRDVDQFHHLVGDDEHPGAGRGLHRLLVRDGDDVAVVVADVEGAPALALDGEHAGVAEVDHVADEDPEGLGDAQAHDPLQPERPIWWTGWRWAAMRAHSGRVSGRGWRVAARGCGRRRGRGSGRRGSSVGSKPAGKRPLARAKREDLAQHPQGVGDVALRQAGRRVRCLLRIASSAATGTRIWPFGSR